MRIVGKCAPPECRRVVCGGCGSTLEYEQPDVKLDWDWDGMGGSEISYYVVCPHCEQRNFVAKWEKIYEYHYAQVDMVVEQVLDKFFPLTGKITPELMTARRQAKNQVYSGMNGKLYHEYYRFLCPLIEIAQKVETSVAQYVSAN